MPVSIINYLLGNSGPQLQLKITDEDCTMTVKTVARNVNISAMSIYRVLFKELFRVKINSCLRTLN